METFVIDSLMAHFFNPQIIDIITEEVNRQIQEALKTDREDVQLAKNALKGLELAQNNLVEAMAQTGYNQTIFDKLVSIEQQIAEHQALIAEEESKRREVKKRIDSLKQQMLNPKNAEQTRVVLQSYIERIVIDNTSVKATLPRTPHPALVAVVATEAHCHRLLH